MKKLKLIIILTIASILFISIGFSAFNSNIMFDDLKAYIRPQSNIRITGITIDNTNNAIANNENYNKEYVTADFTLNNKNSSITYKIKITNFNEPVMGIYDITGLPDYLTYELDNYTLKTKLCNNENLCNLGITKEILLTIKYKDQNIEPTISENNIKLNFEFRKIYNIAYENITNNGYPSEIMEGTTLEIAFNNDIPENPKVTGAESYNFNNSKLTITNALDNVKISNSVIFKLDSPQTFSGNNYINTGINFFSQENINQNFEISFTIDSYNLNQVRYGTLINCMDEYNTEYPGFAFRINAEINKFEMVANNKGNNQVQFEHEYEYSKIKKVKIKRINKKLYYSYNDGDYYEIQNYTNFTQYFNVPLTFGASLDENGNPYRYFNGTLSNIKVKLLDNNETILAFKKKYNYYENIIFNGTNYVNTNIMLFDEQNINKDFEISFKIDNVESEQNIYATLLNIMNEAGTNFPGITFRIYTADTIKYQLVTNGTTNSEIFIPIEGTQKFTLLRKSNILYYNINDTDFIQVKDFTNFTNYFNIPVTIGASIDENGNIYRQFKGTMKDIIIWIKE